CCGKSLEKITGELGEYRQQIDLPPIYPTDNNGSERAIRKSKSKLKVSGQFKSFHGTKVYATIRLVVDTARKNDMRVLPTLLRIANFEKNVLPLTLPVE
ncbi:MAG: hypothetical protein COZ21_05515, partial [Bacteroidetes bacterium CG_4_10_14_3_um_filter_31_20]